ncbi:MAG: FAD-dependent oxidoreductase, partial [Synechococcaceae cyanobacterium ELA182]
MAEHDVIVVGAGAAGASAAFHLAQRGRNVLLLERQPPGWGKPCGGGMAASVQRWFPFDLTPAVDQVIRRVSFSWCLEDPVLAELPGDAPFWIVRRGVLDQFLADRANEAGAEIRHGVEVVGLQRRQGLWRVGLRDGQELSAAAVVVADGSGSTLASTHGVGSPRPRYAATVSVEVEAPLSQPDTARFEFGLVHHGFCWAFPRQGGTSIGVGTFIGQQQADSHAVLAALLPSLGLPPDAGQRRQGRLRIWNGHYPLHGDGVVVVEEYVAFFCGPEAKVDKEAKPAKTDKPTLFETMDTNDNGFVTVLELVVYRIVIFRQLDANGDGKLTP